LLSQLQLDFLDAIGVSEQDFQEMSRIYKQDLQDLQDMSRIFKI